MKRHISASFAPLLCGIAIAGCAGNGSSGAGVLPQNGTAIAAPSHATRTALTLRIRIPKRARIRARFVSPATASATVHIAPKTGCATCSPSRTVKVALTASSPQCSATSSALTCTIAIDAAAGSYAGSLTTYDSIGAILSSNQSFPISVTAGKANAIGVTLYGVPAGVNASLADPKRGTQTYDSSGSETIAVAGAGAHAQIVLTPVDSDDYVIAGPGAPKLSYAISGSTGFKASATPGSPNVATITTPVVRTSGTDKLVVLLSGPGCSQPNAQCAGSVTLGIDPLIATAAANDTVEVETIEGVVVSRIALPTGSSPTSVAFDSRGNLFVAGSNMPVDEFTWPYRKTPALTFGKPALATFCSGMVLDRNDDVLVGQFGGVSMYAPPYTGTPKSQGFVDPQCLGMDGSGNLYITTAYGGGLVLSVPPPFFSGAYNVNAPGGAPQALAVDPTDDIVAVAANNHVYEYDKSLNLLQTSGTFGLTPTSLAYGGGNFGAAVNAGTNASFDVFAVSGLTSLGGYSFVGHIGSVAFDARSHLLLATANGISFWSGPWNPPLSDGSIATANPAVDIAMWP